MSQGNRAHESKRHLKVMAALGKTVIKHVDNGTISCKRTPTCNKLLNL